MQRLGEVVRVAQGLLVARVPAGERPDIGLQVVDEGLDEVGRVVDVFGPTSQPYVAITPDDGVNPALLVGKKVYAR